MKQWKKAVTALLSAGIVIALFFGFQRLVEPKYAEDILEGNFTSEYYEETTKHDVIMIGDCEVYENFDPVYLWKNYGITSYIRGNAQQLAWHSYYMLEDTLKYETPKVVIYNVQALTHREPQREEYNRMALDGMKWSKTKYEAIRASMCEGENMLDYIFPLLRYHQRILDLSESDLTYYWKPRHITHNGYYMRIDVLPVSESDVADPTWLLGEENTEETDSEDGAPEEDDDFIDDPWGDIEGADDDEEDSSDTKMPVIDDAEKGEPFGSYPLEYLDRIRTLCEEHGIQLLLIKAPSLAPRWYSSDNEQVTGYAEKHDLPYINFYELLEETGIDYETDTYDGGLHMNLSGADKLSAYLGKILTQEYGITDHRNDSQLSAAYDKKIAFYEDMKKKQQEELNKYGEIKNY